MKAWLLIIYPHDGGTVRSYRVKCKHRPYWHDISELERYFNATVELKNLSAK